MPAQLVSYSVTVRFGPLFGLDIVTPLNRLIDNK